MGRHPPPPIIFKRQNLTQTNYVSLERQLTANRIHFKYWKNILISRFYEQFSRNDSAIPTVLNMKILYTALKLVIWRFRTCNYFHDFTNTLRSFAKSVLVLFSRNLNISYVHILKVCKFFRTAILEPFRSNLAKIAHKVAKSKYFFNI